jgi:hypothetical protein
MLGHHWTTDYGWYYCIDSGFLGTSPALDAFSVCGLKREAESWTLTAMTGGAQGIPGDITGTVGRVVVVGAGIAIGVS